MIISEYINIFKIIRTPFIYEFIKYFKNIDEKFNKQNIETKLDINEYLEEIEEISQEIIIIMIFKIETNEEDLIKKRNNNNVLNLEDSLIWIEKSIEDGDVIADHARYKRINLILKNKYVKDFPDLSSAIPYLFELVDNSRGKQNFTNQNNLNV